MPNNSEYFRAHLEAEARSREHAQHIGEIAAMCQMMIEETVPILIEKYLADKKLTAVVDVKTSWGGRFKDFKDELTNACAGILQKFLR